MRDENELHQPIPSSFPERYSRRQFLRGAGGLVPTVLLGSSALGAIVSCGQASSSSSTAGPKAGGHMTEGYLYDISTFNPVMATARTTNVLIASLCFDGLLTYSGDGSLAPAIAKAVPKPTSGGTTYEFDLRPNVRWSDGTELTADDVLFTYQLFYDPRYRTVSSAWRSVLETYIAKVEAPSPNKVVFTLSKPYAPFLSNYCIAGIVPKHVLGGLTPAQVPNAPFNLAPHVVNGQFRFSSWVPGQSATLVRNPTYYGGAPKLDAYVFKYVPDINTVSSQLRSGDIDFATIPLNQVNSFKSSSDFRVIQMSIPETTMLMLQLDPLKPASKILSDVRVRRALAHAINMPAMVDAVFFKRAKPIESAVIPSTSWAYDAHPSTTYPYNKSEANSLLDQAGWSRGANGVRTKDGTPLKLEIQTANAEPWESIAQVVQAAWSAVGVDATVKDVETAILSNNVANQRNFDVVVEEFNFNVDPDPTGVISSGAAAPGGLNATDYRNPQVDMLLDEAIATSDIGARRKLYFQVQNILARDRPLLPLVTQPGVYAVRKRLEGFSIGPYTRFTRPWMKNVSVSSS